jgi:hypothetical protein
MKLSRKLHKSGLSIAGKGHAGRRCGTSDVGPYIDPFPILSESQCPTSGPRSPPSSEIISRHGGEAVAGPRKGRELSHECWRARHPRAASEKRCGGRQKARPRANSAVEVSVSKPAVVEFWVQGDDGDGLEPISMPMPSRDCVPSRIGAVTPSSAHSRTSWSGPALSDPVTPKQTAMVAVLSSR